MKQKIMENTMLMSKKKNTHTQIEFIGYNFLNIYISHIYITHLSLSSSII